MSRRFPRRAPPRGPSSRPVTTGSAVVRRARPWLFAVGVLLLGAVEGDGCRSCRKDLPDDPVEDVDRDDVKDVASELQVVSFEPAERPAGAAFTGTVLGAGFAPEARVRVGDTPGTDVVVRDDNTLRLRVPPLAVGTYDVEVVNPDGEKATLRRALRVVQDEPDVTCDHTVVYFSFDDAGLTDESRATLDARLDCLRNRSGRVVLEGHTDERGTISYNLGLGQRRAASVQRHLLTQGIASGRIETVSYGEERPAVSGSTESAWARNRRVEIHAK